MILDKIKAKFARPNPNLTKAVVELGLTERTYHILRRAQIATVGDLVQLSWNNLRAIRGTNRRLCEEVEEALNGMGLRLREERDR